MKLRTNKYYFQYDDDLGCIDIPLIEISKAQFEMLKEKLDSKELNNIDKNHYAVKEFLNILLTH